MLDHQIFYRREKEKQNKTKPELVTENQTSQENVRKKNQTYRQPEVEFTGSSWIFTESRGLWIKLIHRKLKRHINTRNCGQWITQEIVGSGT